MPALRRPNLLLILMPLTPDRSCELESLQHAAKQSMVPVPQVRCCHGSAVDQRAKMPFTNARRVASAYCALPNLCA
jgi:hypothetical protein